jgi:DNA-binding MarR family transcriptional regulator
MTNDADRLRRSPIHLLHRAGQAAEEVFSATMKIEGLTPRQLAVLMTVADNEGANQTDLGTHTGIDRSTIADIVRRLRRKGLLHRRRSAMDNRAYAIKLTDQGRRVLQMAEPLTRQIDERLLGALPTRNREQFLGALQAIVAVLDR